MPGPVIDDLLPQLRSALDTGTRVVLQAPPGAGKTTRVPPALLSASWLDGARIVMLEPRRLAARAAAAFMARALGERVGETVGYRVRLDSVIGPRTRIEVVTEGVLTRMLQADPALDGVGAVIFDEFHERSIHADLGLALTLQSQALLRSDLRILVMSATLDTEALASLLGDAAVITGTGRSFPVETTYLARRFDGHMEPAVAGAAVRAHDRDPGDILVFVPGTAEIRRVAEHLARADLPASTRVIPLYGDLPQAEQDRAIEPSPPGLRKIVLATAIAETSLTIEGVRTVIDSGLMRVPRFSPRTGMTRLVTVPVSRATADQRRGRAGRVAPGVCHRMWTEGEHAALLAHRPPEILEADLAPLALDLAAWGVSDPGELGWIDPPPAAAYAQARELLLELDAVDREGRLTDHGRAMSRLPAHPRLAHMLLRAQSLDAVALACDVAALLGDRDVLRAHDGRADPDLRVRLPLLRAGGRAPHGHTVDPAALHRTRTEAQHWRRRMRVSSRAPEPDDAMVPLLLAFAYPDRVARQRGSRGRFLLRNGSGAVLDAAHSLAGADLIVAAELGGQGREVRIFLAAPLERADLENHFAAHIETATIAEFDVASATLRLKRVRGLGAIVLTEHAVRDVEPAELATALLSALRRHGTSLLSWSESARSLRERLAFLHHHDPGLWPDVSDAALLDSADEWLAPWIASARSGDALRRIDMVEALLGITGWQRRDDIVRLAPTHIEVPSGSRIAVDYSEPASPTLAVRLQEMFGSEDTPRIADGRVPLTLHLLSPARRPVQVTRDLASFWRTTYFDVRRDLRGRYPKHYWPDDPLEAEATRRTRPRRP